MKFVYSLPATKTREKCMYENKWKLEGKKKNCEKRTHEKKKTNWTIALGIVDFY